MKTAESLEQRMSVEWNREEPLLVEPIAHIPDDEGGIAVGHKLWRYMQSRMKLVEDKVEK